MNDDSLSQLCHELVLANHILANENVLDAFGHVSVRHRVHPDRFLLSRSQSPAVVSDSDLMVFDLEGNVVQGEGRPYLERVIHAAIYLARPDVGAIVHHHSASVLPFAITDIPLVPVFHLGALAGESIPVWDSRAAFGDTSLLVTDMAMAGSLAETLGSGTAALLRRHGVVCVGPNLRQMTFNAICMRDNAELLLRATALGSAPDRLSSGEIALAAAAHDGGGPVERAWTYWTQRLT